ncbi:MAG: Cobalamin-binding protein precursor [Methanocella sp. PtaU1.Bin125]|nr:MAG: Cobalamin-binding protein precursor [Methanocella sp. PtaU1.Bin125]
MRNEKFLCLALAILAITAAMAGCLQASPATPGPSAAPGAGITFADGNSNVITIPKTADRIISTNSDCTEMLIAIGAADKIVGVSETVMDTPALMALLPPDVKSIGSWSSPSLETILSLRPDVVICYTYSTFPSNLDMLVAYNITIVALDCYKLGALESDARTLGVITGNKQQADEYASFFDRYLKLVQGRTRDLDLAKMPTVYWEGYSDYSTVSGTSGGNIMIGTAGGNNVAGNYSTSYPQVSAEWVVYQDPAYIFKSIAAANVTSIDDFRRLQADVAGRPGFRLVEAVKSDNVYVMSGAFASGARSMIGLLYVAKILHPDLFADVDPQQVLAEYAQKFLPGADRVLYIYPDIG